MYIMECHCDDTKCECMVSVKCMFTELEQTVQLQILSCKSDNLLIPIEKLHNLTSMIPGYLLKESIIKTLHCLC